MLPIVYGQQHARVPPRQFPIVHGAVPRVVQGLLGLARDGAMVLVGDGMLDVRFGRLRLCSPLTNVADVTPGASGVRRSSVGIRYSTCGRGLVVGTAGYSDDVDAVRVRFHRTVSMVGPAVVLRARWVDVTTVLPVDLVAALLDGTAPPGPPMASIATRRSGDTRDG